MAGGLLAGLRHTEAVRFAFLLATPVILAAGLLEVPQLPGSGAPSACTLWARWSPGALAYISARLLIRYFEIGRLDPFAVVLCSSWRDRPDRPSLTHWSPMNSRSPLPAILLALLGVLFFAVAIFYATTKTGLLASDMTIHYKHATVARCSASSAWWPPTSPAVAAPEPSDHRLLPEVAPRANRPGRNGARSISLPRH